MERWVSSGGTIDLRLGRWQDVLADVTSCDAVITDPPYSDRTHDGALSSTGESGVTGYACMTDGEARSAVRHWSSCAAGWVVFHTDDVLSPSMRDELHHAGRYTFTMVPVLQHQPRVTGDGPAPPGHFLVVARPRTRDYATWGSLPGWYQAQRDASVVRGGKPLLLMRAIVRDYTLPGDLVVDPFCGGGTTALACALEGRRCITSEVDPATFTKAVRRLQSGWSGDLFAGSAQK